MSGRQMVLVSAVSGVVMLAASWASAGGTACAAAQDQSKPPVTEAVRAARPDGSSVIQIALLLDTSGSMEGLIHQARARLWDIVNDFSLATKNGKRPTLQVAVYQYGSSQLPSSEGFLRCVQPFTSNLDLISDRLFALTIAGSDEYCGMVMDAAVKSLDWDNTPTTATLDKLPLRMIVIAGNEEFTQGPVGFESVAGDARARGILVNTIYCGQYHEGEKTGWKSAAQIARSCYNAIDHSHPLAEVRTPFDDDLNRLNSELNGTYVAYGVKGAAGREMQEKQDTANMQNSPASAPARAASKASGFYRQSTWDLVDAVKDGTDLNTIPTADLPEIMRPMTIREREEYVRKMQTKRDAIRQEIRTLDERRRGFLRDHANKPGRPETLDSAIIKCVREQAKGVGFSYSQD